MDQFLYDNGLRHERVNSYEHLWLSQNLDVPIEKCLVKDIAC